MKTAAGWALPRALAWTVPVLLYLAWVAPVFEFKVDDVFISLRFAENLARGYGLTFSPGSPPMEAFTNMLLVLLEAAFFRAGLPGLLVVKVFLVLCGVVLLVVLSRYGVARLADAPDGPWIALAVAALVATSSPLVLWSASGMETALFAALATGALIQHLRWTHGFLRKTSGIFAIDLLFFACLLTRPEGLLFWTGASAHALFRLLRGHHRVERATRLGSMALCAAALVSYGAWKASYFGAVLPATSVAKLPALSWATWAGGLERCAAFLSIDGNFLVAALVAAALAVALRKRESIDRPIWLVAALTAAYAAYLVALGPRVAMDDAFRFFVPLVPLSGLLLFEAAALLAPARRRWPGRFVAGAVAVAATLAPLRAIDLRHAWTEDLNWGSLAYKVPGNQVGRGLDQAHVALGKWLKTHAPPGATVVLYDAGAIPYFSGLPVIDTWSLVDPVLVELKRDHRRASSEAEREALMERMRGYVLSRRPEFIVQDDLALLEDPGVRSQYRPLGKSWTYLDSYDCEPGRACGYSIEPWVRADLFEASRQGVPPR